MGNKQEIYVGTYSLPIQFGTGEIFHGKGKGIYRFEFDTDRPELRLVNITEGADNSSYLTVNSDVSRLYAINELKVLLTIRCFSSGLKITWHGSAPCVASRLISDSVPSLFMA